VIGGEASCLYKGLALASDSGGVNHLYATNFHANTIDVFDSSFNQVALGSGAFKDPTITDTTKGTVAISPSTPSDFAPFGIQSIGNVLFVTYAKQKPPDNHDDQAGPGNGFVDEFTPNGQFIQRVASQGTLDSPWGVALAPHDFGRFSNDLLVGNFGDGRINAFKRNDNGSFQFDGQLADKTGKPITIDGLRGLKFGNDAKAGDTSTLSFTAGIGDEQQGLFGSLTAHHRRDR
jgi:uncharacterized protein (TIGR03118 family)